MKPKMTANLEAVFGTLFFLFLVLPIFFIYIPYKIVSYPNHALLFDIGVWRYSGLILIVLGAAGYFGAPTASRSPAKAPPYRLRRPKSS